MRKILLLLLILSPPVFPQNLDGWELKRNSKGIKVYTRTVEGTNIKEYRSQMLVDTNVDRVVDCVLDYDLMLKWNKTVVDYKVVGKKHGGDLIYMENKAAWPVSNRDNICLVVMKKNYDGSAHIYLESIEEDLVPLKDGVVRMYDVEGVWRIAPYENKTLVIQEMYGDPEGNIPAAFVNGYMVSSAFKTFESLRKVVEEKKD